jgi:hypothetical protein
MRIWIKGEPCYDQEPIQAYIMDLEKEIERLKRKSGEICDDVYGPNVSITDKEVEKAKIDIAAMIKVCELKDKRIAELESWLKPFHGNPEDVRGYTVYGLDPNTPSGLPMIPESEKGCKTCCRKYCLGRPTGCGLRFWEPMIPAEEKK